MGQNQALKTRCKIIGIIVKGLPILFLVIASGIIGHEWNESQFAQIKREDDFTIKAYKKLHYDDSIEIAQLKALTISQEELLKNQSKFSKEVKHIGNDIDTILDNTKKKRK